MVVGENVFIATEEGLNQINYKTQQFDFFDYSDGIISKEINDIEYINGTLILGTNKGMTVLKVNNQGTPIDVSHFDASNGFGGYETYMRSQFQSKEGIFVGTIEGLFLINTKLKFICCLLH